MRKLILAPNLTAVLAGAALCELAFFRIASAIFLPSQAGTRIERWFSDAALFASNFAGILALLITVTALTHALRSDHLFPRSMRITVSTVGLFFCALAGAGVLWTLGPGHYAYLRISHGFLAFFLALGIWHGRRRDGRAKLSVTLFALPVMMQTFAFFGLRMGWTRLDPQQLVRVAHALWLLALATAPILIVPLPWGRLRAALTVSTAVVLAAGLGALMVLRFDLVQASLFYGLHIDLTGLATTTERLYSGALVVAFSCAGAGIVACMVGPGKTRLGGWGLLLLAVAGTDMGSPKPALFTLCGLLAIAVAGGRDGSAMGQTFPSARATAREGLADSTREGPN